MFCLFLLLHLAPALLPNFHPAIATHSRLPSSTSSYITARVTERESNSKKKVVNNIMQAGKNCTTGSRGCHFSEWLIAHFKLGVGLPDQVYILRRCVCLNIIITFCEMPLFSQFVNVFNFCWQNRRQCPQKLQITLLLNRLR